ncbi:MAG: hypothetical protein Q7J60_17155, partial [Bradyrhizobium sp.]|nr:hypothetical protein [Bradyrhizobium sp.]
MDFDNKTFRKKEGFGVVDVRSLHSGIVRWHQILNFDFPGWMGALYRRSWAGPAGIVFSNSIFMEQRHDLAISRPHAPEV